MAAIPVTLVGSFYDPNGNPGLQQTFIGLMSWTGLSVGGGPVIPPDRPPASGPPPHPAFPIWGGPGTIFPPKPGYPPVAGWPLPPGWETPIWPGPPPVVDPGPIVPPDGPPTLPPDYTPPPPGSPPVIVQPPNAALPPVTVPPFILVNYPGIGWIVVPQPVPPSNPQSGAVA